MASIINLTPQQPIALTIAAGDPSPVSMPILSAVDIAGIDFLDLELGVAASGLATVTIGIATGMSTDNNDNWINLGATVSSLNFGSITVASTAQMAYQIKSFGPNITAAPSPLLRYVRWTVAFTGTSGFVTFTIRGMARRLGSG